MLIKRHTSVQCKTICTCNTDYVTPLGLEHSGMCLPSPMVWFCDFSPNRFLKTFMKEPLILDPPTSMTLAPLPTTRVTNAAPQPGQTECCGGGRSVLLIKLVSEAAMLKSQGRVHAKGHRGDKTSHTAQCSGAIFLITQMIKITPDGKPFGSCALRGPLLTSGLCDLLAGLA